MFNGKIEMTDDKAKLAQQIKDARDKAYQQAYNEQKKKNHQNRVMAAAKKGAKEGRAKATPLKEKLGDKTKQAVNAGTKGAKYLYNQGVVPVAGVGAQAALDVIRAMNPNVVVVNGKGKNPQIVAKTAGPRINPQTFTKNQFTVAHNPQMLAHNPGLLIARREKLTARHGSLGDKEPRPNMLGNKKTQPNMLGTKQTNVLGTKQRGNMFGNPYPGNIFGK